MVTRRRRHAILSAAPMLAADNAVSIAGQLIAEVQTVGVHNSFAIPVSPREMVVMALTLEALDKYGTAWLPEDRRVTLVTGQPGGSADLALPLHHVQVPIEAGLRMGMRRIGLKDRGGERSAHPKPH